VDDALALAILHALESRGEAKLLAVTITKDNRWAAPYIDAVNTFYGRPEIPVGVVRDGKTPEDSAMIRVPCERRKADGSLVYPRRILDGRQAPDAVALLRRTLAREADQGVTIVQVGFSTSLARLLDTPPDSLSPLGGRELAAKKVRLLVAMAGEFPAGKPEYNIRTDLAAARKLFAEWPGAIVASGFEIGNAMRFPASRLERDFSYTADHPVVDAYRNYQKMPYDRQTWDLTAALYAVRPGDGYFTVSPPGTITVDPDGRTRFSPAQAGRHSYLKIDAGLAPRTLEAMVELASQPPGR